MKEKETKNQKMSRPFYLRTGFILFLSMFWIVYGIPLLAAFVLMYLQGKHDQKHISNLTEIVRTELKSEADEILATATSQADKIVSDTEFNLKTLTSKTHDLTVKKNETSGLLESLEERVAKLEKQEENLKKRIGKLKPAHKALKDSIEYYHLHGEYTDLSRDLKDLLYPSVELPLHSLDVKVLKKQATALHKDIDNLLGTYEKRYTTKANKSIYALMVITLQSELQNVLYNLKYEKIDQTREYISEIALKYIDIAGKGNKSIYSTLVKFIGEIESIFLQLADVEYQYYVKREREKEEQRLIREQMRQEATERKLLAEQKKKIEAEESKYHTEIDNLEKQLEVETDASKHSQLEAKIKELQRLLSEVEDKKEEIVNLQNGKAGNVYIISNVGSFGEGTFKVGMTRRLEPMERIKELSSASVPFAFDVHSFIFSEDAPALEKKMHDVLHESRVNKMNLRKEFFKTSIDEMEQLVSDLDPTAEFKRTLISQEYEMTIEIENEKSA